MESPWSMSMAQTEQTSARQYRTLSAQGRPVVGYKLFTSCVPVLGVGLPCPGVCRFASISNRICTTASTMLACSGLQQLYTGCVSVLSSGLLCPGVGSVNISYNNRSVTGCVPALGGGLSCPGVGGIGVTMNRLVTGCVPALNGRLLCPGVDRVGVSMNRSVTGCVPVPGSNLPGPSIGCVLVSLCFCLTLLSIICNYCCVYIEPSTSVIQRDFACNGCSIFTCYFTSIYKDI